MFKKLLKAGNYLLELIVFISGATIVMLVAVKSKNEPTSHNENYDLRKLLQNMWTKEVVNDLPILNDDFAPVDYYLSKVL